MELEGWFDDKTRKNEKKYYGFQSFHEKTNN